MTMSRRTAIRSLLGAAGAASVGSLGPGPVLGGDRPPGGPSVADLQPYRIDFGRDSIDDLHRRIDQMRWPEMPFDTGWSSGTSDRVLRELVDFWRNEYDWFAIQDDLNRLNHLRGPIAGDQIHCVKYEGAGSGAHLPLLLIHGWPSSFVEFLHAAPILANGANGTPSFDLIVPSLPGFAFSEAPREPGVSPGRMAERLHALMGELGYERYGVQGGDWGAIIGTQMARRYPDSVVGLHVSFVSSAPPPPEGVEPTAEEVAYREARARFSGAETGYSSIQGSRPQTLAYAQADSPVGWLAWMLEKYWAWGDHGGDLWSVFRREDILTTAMAYWLPGRVLSAARIYHEGGGSVGGRVEVPTGYAHFPKEPWGPPREVVERSYNLVHYSRFPRGGHFPALEQTVPWAGDVSRFFSAL